MVHLIIVSLAEESTSDEAKSDKQPASSFFKEDTVNFSSTGLGKILPQLKGLVDFFKAAIGLGKEATLGDIVKKIIEMVKPFLQIFKVIFGAAVKEPIKEELWLVIDT